MNRFEVANLMCLGLFAAATVAAVNTIDKESTRNSGEKRPGERDPCTVLDVADVEAGDGRALLHA